MLSLLFRVFVEKEKEAKISLYVYMNSWDDEDEEEEEKKVMKIISTKRFEVIWWSEEGSKIIVNFMLF